MNKFVGAVLLLGASISSANATTDINEDFSLDGFVGFASQYRSRGLGMSQGDPALQFNGYITSKKTGLYLGSWVSSTDFGHDTKNRYEADYYAGWFVPFSEDVNLDIGYIEYTYPKLSSLNFSETYGILTAYGFKVAAQYSTDYELFGKDQSTMYTWIGYETDIPYGFRLSTRYGKMDYKDPVFYSTDWSTRDSYKEWEVKVSHEFVGLNWELSYIDTDLSKHECMYFMGYDDLCSATALATVSKKF
ncbi:TorF family putative porin [Pseudomonas sp. LABIM340]|uniref:TorF family putative porin n=1 Tax=Pseudomonas sp. LABIM340 TaxID=3156585 RepID=UPI0032AEA9E5